MPKKPGSKTFTNIDSPHGNGSRGGPPPVHRVIFAGLVAIAVMVTGRTFVANRSNGAGMKAGMTKEQKTPKSNSNAAVEEATAAAPAAANGAAAAATKADTQLRVYKTIPPLPGSQERKIVFLHVGKTGGVSFRKNTALGCLDEFPDASDPKREECLKAHPDHNVLAKLTKDVAQAGAMDEAKLFEATSFVIMIRDPIERIISSFRSAHPENCPGDKKSVQTHGCTLMEKNLLESGLGYTLYKKCFPSPGMEDFAQAILPPYDTMPEHWNEFTNDDIAECRKLARQMVQGLPNSGMDPHMEFNYQHFMQATALKYKDKEFFAVRTDQMIQDMKRLDRLLGGQGNFKEEGAYYRQGSDQFKPSPLSDGSLLKLCCVLEKELNVYFGVFDLAINMDGEDRSQANNRLRATCGVWDGEAWLDWRKRCWKAMEEPLV